MELVGIDHDDGNAHDVNALDFSLAVSGIDVAFLQVLFLVVTLDSLVEVGDDSLAHFLYDVGVLHNHDEIVAAYVAHKVVFNATFSHYIVQGLHQEENHLVAFVEAIVFVVFLEVVQVDIHHSKVLSTLHLFDELAGDDVVARQAREGVLIAIGLNGVDNVAQVMPKALRIGVLADNADDRNEFLHIVAQACRWQQ